MYFCGFRWEFIDLVVFLALIELRLYNSIHNWDEVKAEECSKSRYSKYPFGRLYDVDWEMSYG